MEMFDDDVARQAEDAWNLFAELVPALDARSHMANVEAEQLLASPISEKLATCLLLIGRRPQRSYCLTDKQLHEIAAEDMTPGRAHYEHDVDESPGIYVFISLVERQIYKVGQSANLRSRITSGHLRYGDNLSESNLIDFCRFRNADWPQCIVDGEFTALVFPLHGSTDEERCFIEAGLQSLLNPLMP